MIIFLFQNEHAGLIVRFVNNLYEELHLNRLEFTVKVSFIELYNEEIYDLLSNIEGVNKIRLFEDTQQKGTVLLHGMEEAIVRGKNELYTYLINGYTKQRNASLLNNNRVGKSHLIFTLKVLIREMNSEGEEVLRCGKVNFVDLAGSENMGKAGMPDKKNKDIGNMNTSIFTLGRVTRALVEKSSHIPYR